MANDFRKIISIEKLNREIETIKKKIKNIKVVIDNLKAQNLNKDFSSKEIGTSKFSKIRITLLQNNYKNK